MKHSPMSAIVLIAALTGGLSAVAYAGNYDKSSHSDWAISWQNEFSAADENQDGSLSSSEYSRFQTALDKARMGREGMNGKSKNGKSKMGMKTRSFSDADTNHDNKVSQDELAAFYEKNGGMHGKNSGMQGQNGNMKNQSYTGTDNARAGTPVMPTMDLVGQNVKNLKGETVGEIDKLVVSKQDHAVYAILSVGGFIGIGDKDVAVPLKNMQVKDGRDVVLVSQQSESKLKNMPEYKPDMYTPYNAKNDSSGDKDMKKRY